MMINLTLLIDQLNVFLLRFLQGKDTVEKFLKCKFLREFSSPLRRVIEDV